MAALAFATPAAADLDLRRADVSHLPNGLTVIMLEDHSFPVVSVQMLYKSGSAAEVTGKTGLAHFLEHLAFRGSEHFPNALATELIYDSGGEWHGYTAMDQTTYFATMPKDGLDLLLKIEADRMTRVVIDPASIDAEMGAVITELHSYENDPASVLQEAVTRTAIQAHPYGSPMAGYVSDVERLTIDDARAYYANHYAPGNAVLAIVGDFVPAAAKALVARDFADVSARLAAQPSFTIEPDQTGERRIVLAGPVDRQHVLLAFHSAAASNADFPALLLLQQILTGTPGLDADQDGWSGTPATKGSVLYGLTDDMGSWLPATRDTFLFMINGSIAATADPALVERQLRSRISLVRDQLVSPARLAEAKAAVGRALVGDVLTTEDAAHQLAFFEGIGALDALLDMPARVSAVTPADLKRVARTYLAPDQLTVGWMSRTKALRPARAPTNPARVADRPGIAPATASANGPILRHLSGGLPAIMQANPLSETVTAELLMNGPVEGGSQLEDLPGLDVLVRTGPASDLEFLLREVARHKRKARSVEPRSDDPATRLQQLITAEIGHTRVQDPRPLAVIVSGKVDQNQTFEGLEREFGQTSAGRLAAEHAPSFDGPKIVRERIDKPLAQGGIGYVVEGPSAGTRHALAWQMLLYVLTHDYSGRLGTSAIRDRGIVYHIYSRARTDGRRTWATISTGVDPDKADAMQAELQAQLGRLVSEPPTAAEVEAARNHLLGRDLTQAQSNEELTAKIAREFVETGGLRSHEQLHAILETITPVDLAKLAPLFAKGTIVRVDVGVKPTEPKR